MLAIYKRELKSYFCSFIGCLFIGVTLFFIGLYYTVYNLTYGYPYFSYVISSVVFLFLVTVPILTMRILAEERKNKTDQLILTVPVSVGGVVMGKFLALTTIFLIPTVISCIYPLLLTKFGSVPLGEAYLSILAFFLYGIACIAIGILISSLTESLVIAAVLGFGILFLGYMMSSLCSLISGTGNILTTILSCFDMYTPFYNMLQGTLNLDDVAYFLSLTGFALFLTVQSIQKRRYSVSVKTFSLGAYNTGMIAVVAAILVIFNIILGELPATWTNIDLTYEKLYTLTDQTKEFVNNMTDDVTIYVLVNEKNQDTTLGQTLERYDDLSDHIMVEYVDPVVNPTFYTQYTDSSLSTNSLIVVSDKRSKVISADSIYETAYDYSTYTSYTSGYDGEGQITSAIDFVTRDDMPKIYFLEGHGEYSFSSTFTASLTKENVDYSTINLLNYDSVPEDASSLVIYAPASDFSEDDKNKIISYLEGGGSVVTISGYATADMTNFDEVLSYMGLSIADGIVMEQDSGYYYQSQNYLLPELISSVYTSGIYNSYYIFAPYAQGIVIEDESSEELSYTIFLSTSDSAYSMIDVSVTTATGKQEGDIDGPFGIGVEAVKELDTGTATMVLYSCELLFTDEANQMVSGANLMLFTNTVSRFVEHTVSVSIPVKSYEVSTLLLSQSQIVLLGLIATIILPVGCLIAGFVIWFRRRRR